MSRYRIPADELRKWIDPLDGVKWSCGPITSDDVLTAVKMYGFEERCWQDVNTAQLPPEENRTYHLRRVGTLMHEAYQNPDGSPHPDINQRIVVAFYFGNDGRIAKFWAYDGNHRIATAYLLEREFIDVDVSSPQQERILELLPGAKQINDVPKKSAGTEF